MKKLLLLLCIPFIFSCGEKNEEDKDGGKLSKEITKKMIKDGYTGKGTSTFANGDKYVGEWKDGKFNGQGTKISGTKAVAGAKYVGEWKDGKMNGQGTLTYANGDEYVGKWKDRNMNGQGTYTYANGTVFKGLWENGKFLGE